MSYADFKFLGLNRFPTSLYMWGDNTNGLLGDNRTPSYFSWSKISSGGLHTLAIRSDGTLFAWGRNDQGQIGDTTTTNRSSPVQIGTNAWLSVSAGYSHSMAIRSDYSMWAWGGNIYGQLGDTSTVAKSSPVQAPGSGGSGLPPFSWLAVSSGRNHTAAVSIDGYLFAWGQGSTGQTGVRYSPVITGVQQGGVITNDGSVWGAGWNTTGFIGNATLTQSTSPIQIGGSWSFLSANRGTRIGMKADGKLWGMGGNSSGMLGDGTTVDKSIPIMISSDSWSMISISTLVYTLGIKYDGTLWAWGSNGAGYLGQNDTVSRSSPTQIGTSSWSFVKAGGSTVAAIDSAGRLFTWGLGTSGQLGDGTLVTRSSPVQVGVGSSWIHAAIGATQLYAIRNDFVLFASGNNGSTSGWLGGHPLITSDVSTLTQHNTGSWSQVFAIGDAYGGLGQKTDGTVWGWGANLRGEIGDGTATVRSSPVQVSTYTGSWTQIGQAEYFGYRGYYNNSAYAWGYNVQGELGINDSNARSAPTQISIPASAYTYTILRSAPIQISSNRFSNTSAGFRHTLALDITGKLYALGNNIYGELGDSTTINRSSLVQIGTSSWSTISSGGTHTAAITSTGSLFTWGFNGSGQLGYNSSYIGDYWTQISEGPTHTLAIRNDGALFAWGRNQLGQLGTSDTVSRSSPVQIGTSSWTSIDAGNSHSVAVRSDGKLFTWGANDWGQLGNNPSDFANIGWSKIISSSTGAHSLAIKNDGTLWAWGLQGSDGRLGDGTTTSKSSPTQVGLLNTWIDVAAGRDHSMGITNDYVLYTWGSSTFGQLGDGTNVAKTSPIVIGTNFKKVFAGLLTSIAIDNNDYAYIWGDNTNGLIPGGQIGVHRSNITLALLNNDTWRSFSVEQHVLGIKTNSTLWAWGLNNAGQLGVGNLVNRSSPTQVGTSSWIQVSAGVSYSIGITTDNSLYAWGFNSSGQLGLSDTVSRSVVTVVGAVAGFQSSPDSYSTQFTNSSSQYLSLYDNSSMNIGTSDFTIEGWIRTTTAVANKNAIITAANAAENTFGFALMNGNPGSQWQLNVGNGTNWTITGIVLWTDVPNTWKHFAISRTGGILYAFVDGVLAYSVANTTNIPTNYFQIGAQTRNSRYFDGYMSNIRVIIGSGIYSASFTPSSVPLTTVSNTKLLTLQNTTIVDNSGLGQTITNNAGATPGSLVTPFSATAIAAGSTIATQVIAGQAHTLMLNSTGNLYTWGLNNVGQLGDTTVVARSSPVQVGTDLYNSIIASNSRSTVIRSTDNALFTWGLNSSGELGDSSTINQSSPIQIGTVLYNQSSPVQIGTINYTSVSAGEGHTLGLGTDGVLYGWGKNDQGQIGGQANTLGIGWSKVVIGPTHSLGIRFDGRLYTWGANATGQLGDRTTISRSSPVQLGTGTWKDITVGQNATVQFSMAIRTDGKLFAWGNNTLGQLGYMSWRQVSVGTGHSLLLRSDGALYAMGTNTAGQIGDATTVNKSSPVLLGTSSWSFINTGVSTSVAIDSRGRLFTWGLNNVGQLGIATTANRSSPVQVTTGSWSQVAVEDYMLAITTQGSLWSWGNNNNGQLGLGTTVNSKVPKLLDGTTTSYSIGFDGIGDYLTLGGQSNFAFGTGNFTVEMWYYPTSLPAGGQILYDTNLSGDATGTGRFEILVTTAGVIQLQSGAGVTQTQGGSITLGNWYHIAITRASGSTRIYQNGIQVNTTFTDANNYTNNTNRPIIGANGFNLSIPTFGYISNLRVVKGQALYTSAFTPSTAPLTTTSQGISTGTVSLLTLQDSTIIDNSGNGFTITSVGTPAVAQFNPFSGMSSTGSTSWTRVAAGTHSLAINNTNNLYAWGLNSTGQLGDNTTINKSSPIQIGNSSWTLISASMTGHSLAVDPIGTLYAWGNNIYGELGLNNEYINVSSPTQITSANSFTSISAGYNASMGITTINNINTAYGWGYNNYNQLAILTPFTWRSVGIGSGIQASIGLTYGKLYTWGDNTYGQLGNNTTISRSSPTQVGGYLGSSTYKFTVNSILNTAFIANDNSLFMLGDNTYGQLGQGDTISRSSPVQVGAVGNWSTIAISGTGHVVAIASNGTLFAWGRNDYNELGQNDNVVSNRSSPVIIGGNSDWTKVSAGNNFSVAITATGGMYTWGRNDIGQLGRTNPLSYTNIGAGIVSRNDGKLYTWGHNHYGQLGNNLGGVVAAYRSAPTQIDSVAFASTSWTSVSGSHNNRGGIKIDGKLFVWGDNRSGQLGINEAITDNPSRSQPVQILGSWTQLYVNTDNMFAIRSDNTLWAWGNNNIGQLGINDTVSRSSPVQIGTDVNWSTIVASATGHVLGLKSTGQLLAWGNNLYNELGQNQRVQIHYSSPIQIGTSSWTSIGVGNNNSFAIRTDGALFGWGRNEYGQIGLLNNIPLSWTQIAGGDSYSMAIRSDGKLFSWGRNDKGQLGDNTTINKSLPSLVTGSSASYYSYRFFGGAGPYFSIADNAAFAIGTNSACVEFWFYAFQTDAFPGTYTTFNGQNPTSLSSLRIGLDNNGLIRYSTTSDATSFAYYPVDSHRWYHVVLTYNGGTSRETRFFIDGILRHVGTAITSIPDVAGSYEFGGEDTNAFTGYMSNFRLCNGSIPTTYVTSSTTTGTTIFTPPTTPLTTTSQGATANDVKILTCQSSSLKDNSNNNWSFTVTTPITPVTFNPFTNDYTSYSWTQVSATLSHTVAIRNDGALFTWGANNNGQLGLSDTTNRSAPVQIGNSSWTKVGAGNDASFAIRTDAGLFAWGDNTNGILGQDNTINLSSPLQIGTSSWVQLSATQHILATTSTNNLFTWGINNAGQLGLSDTINRSSPVQVGTSSWSLISAGSSFSMATLSGGVLYTWGLGLNGVLGSGATTSRSSPVQVGASSWSQISAGSSWAAAVLGTGGLYTWGAGVNGELGSGATASRSSPVQVGLLTTWGVLSGKTHALSITTAGALFTWGTNTVGQLGDNTVVVKSSPAGVAALTGQVFDNVSSPTQIGTSSWTQVAAGDMYSMALRATDRFLFTWGYGQSGRLGSGATTSRSSPVQVGTSSWLQINTGGTMNPVALTIAYTLFSWSKNFYGQVGDASTTDRLAPTAVGAALNTNLMTDIIKTVAQVGASSWTQVSAGDSHVYAIKAVDNGLFTWGKNDQGQLGQNIATTIHRSSPVQISAGSQYTIISAGYSYGAAVTILGTLFTTGLNDKGQQGAATVVGRSAFTAVGASVWSQVSAGASTMIGVTTSNVVFVWGGNTSGQLGLGDTANRSSPVQLGSNLAASMYQTVYPIPTIVNTATTASWTQIGIGNEFSVGIENSGRLYAWGRNNTGQLGNGTVVDTTPTKSSPTQLATTASSFTFINTSSPVQVGTNSWNAVSSGGTHTVAIRSDGTLWAWGRNNFGQVGTLSTLDQYIPKQIDILNSYTSVAAGSDFSVAINSDYSLWRWGFNTSTDLASPHRSNPLQLGNIQYNKISAGGATALAITTGGLLYGWGRITTDDNFYYNLNIDPITWGVGFSYRDINAGDSFIHAVRTDYSLWAYGLNASGQLGINNTITRSSPVQLGTNYSWSIIGNGISSTPISAGALFLAGANTSGQLGVNDTNNKSSPVMLPANPQSTFAYPVRIGTNRFIQISAGNSHSMAIRDDYGLFAWGYNFNGQLGNNTNANTSSPVQISAGISWIQVSAGREHTAAIRLDNTLWTWGLNTRGQIGDSTTTNRLAPVQIAGYWNNVIAGASHTAAIADNNTLYIWGDDNFGQ